MTFFENTFLEPLDEHATVKKKFWGANHALNMTKALRKAIMRRSELKSKYFKNKTAHDFETYQKHKTTVANCVTIKVNITIIWIWQILMMTDVLEKL